MSIGSWSASKGISSGRNATADTMECCTHSFIANAGIKETELVWNFFNMVEFSGATVKGMKSLEFSSDFSINMLKAFEEFDQLPLGDMYPNGGLITQQFTALAQKCRKKGVKIFFANVSQGIPGITTDRVYLTSENTPCIICSFSQDIIEKRLNDKIYVMQKDGDHAIVKTISYVELFLEKNVKIDELTHEEKNILTSKVAAYIALHELFHTCSFLDCLKDSNTLGKNGDVSAYDSLNLYYKHTQNPFCKAVNQLLNDDELGDDARNVLGLTMPNETRVPGEFELLNALCKQPTMKFYCGKETDFNHENFKLASCIVFNGIFNETIEQNKIELRLENTTQQHPNVSSSITMDDFV